MLSLGVPYIHRYEIPIDYEMISSVGIAPASVQPAAVPPGLGAGRDVQLDHEGAGG